MEELAERYKKLFGRHPALISSAPGRINIIGEHTDYNRGLVLPAAIDRQVCFLAAPRNDDRVVLWAENFGEKAECDLKNLFCSSGDKWAAYVIGVFGILEKEGYPLGGINGFISGDIPIGSGLSSSAALCVSVTKALNGLFGLSLPPERIPLIAQRAEKDYVGVECGLMDQYISVFGRADQALFLDCATLQYEYVPLPLKENGLRMIVVDSKVRRRLAASEYNRRKEECSEVLHILNVKGVKSLREISLEMIEGKKEKLGHTLFRRARHVLCENERVMESVQALKSKDFTRLGELIFASHRSLRDDYEVSCPELDLLCFLGEEYDGCLGARLTGAGFGGSGIALVQEEKLCGFKEKIKDAFMTRQFEEPYVLEVDIGEGAAIR